MKLVEIKNSLAKLYYQPGDFPLVLSDFLTIDDENQKILSQVVSIESTNKEDTNCAILKFSLDINDKGHCAYSGYAPALDAVVSKTEAKVLDSVFSGSSSSFCLGELSNTSGLSLDINSCVLDKFIYIQSDTIEDTENINSKIFDFINSKSKKTLVIDYDSLCEHENASVIELGKDFKLPIDNEVLNYIYENDLTGLTVEQKTIVQDIILEIQDYIETLESGFIPFNTLLDVVNGIYETDKSVGIILLRNKLLKYNQFNIFASEESEISSIFSSIEKNTLTVLKVKNANTNWQKEALNFVINNLKTQVYLVLNVDDDVIDKETLNTIYKSSNFKPIISSRYDSSHCAQLKSFAKNLVLFKPEEQQRAFATYNSFLGKLAQGEFIVSGEATFFTPLIIKQVPEKFEEKEQAPPTIIETQEIIEVPKIEEQNVEEVEAQVVIEDELSDDFDFESVEIQSLQELEEPSELKNIFEESLEEEIAKDVDQMFYSEGVQEEPYELEEPEEIFEESETVENENEINYEEIFSDDDLDMLDSLNSNQEDSVELLEVEPLEELTQEEPVVIEGALTENDSLPSIPIYSTETNNDFKSDEAIKIAEGNIVYHEKYGRGVVEQLISYGKKTLCSIQFDNVGRRLLDPNLADLKQM